MQRGCFALLAVLFVLASLVAAPVSAQSSQTLTGRIGAIDESSLTALKGNRHPLATPANDRGEVSPDLPMERMLLVLQPDPAAGAALRDFIASQQDKSSDNFHVWLTPEQFAARFGIANTDRERLKSWLESNGFRVGRVARGGLAIEFSGSAGQVKQAFHTSIHAYAADGATRYANASDPQIPTALASTVAGVATLHNFDKPSPIRVLGTAARVAGSSLWQPNFTYAGAAGPVHYLAPGDFAKIYSTAPLYASGIDGTGQSIAIVGRSNIFLSDIQIFRVAFGLPTNDPQIILDGPDPGDLLGGEETEADLDVEWSGAVAPKATIDFVVSASTNSTDGADLSAEYIVDNDLAPVMSTSFGECESQLGQAENTFYNNLWAQAAAEGITAVVASGDSGAAGCDYPAYGPATQGTAVSGLASTPFNVAAGGTQFNENGNENSYWSATDAADQSSVLGYIPEQVWNESCSDITTCSYLSLYASGGGVSTLYAKPSWQAGPGVPPDGKRDLPDVSLAAAAEHDGLLLCQDGSCLTDANGQIYNAEVVGGTSAAAPSFAAIMALVVQHANSRQGQANVVLYPLAAADSASGCNASGPPQAGCVFNDVTEGNNNVPGQAGASAGPGYDLASGLGSVNAANLVAKWNDIAFRPSTTTLALSPVSITHGQAVTASVTVAAGDGGSGTPTGSVALLTGGPQNLGLGNLSGGSITSLTPVLPGGTYTATAAYAGDSTFAPSKSPGVAVTVNPEPSTLTFTSSTSNSTTTSSSVASTYSEYLTFSASVAGASEKGSATGTVTISDRFNGSTATLAAAQLNSQANLSVYNSTLAIGTHTLSASYSGDPSFKSSTAGPVTITVSQGPTGTDLFTSTGVEPNSSALVQAIVFPLLGSVFPTGTVQFLDGGKPLGSPVTIINEIATLNTSQLTAGANSITATYSGDANFTGSSAAATSVFVGNPSFQIAVNPGNVTVSSSTPGKVTLLLTPGQGLGFYGSVSFSCSGLPSGSSCAFQPATVNLDGVSTLTDTMTISTTATSAGIIRSGASWKTARSLAAPLSMSFACSLLLIWPRKRRMHTWLLLAVALGLLSVQIGCGGGGSASTQSGGSTTTLSTATTTPYIVVVTAAGAPATGSGEAAVSQTVSLSVTIQ